MTRTTLDTLTNQQIRSLRAEASNHNDDAMVTVCNAALGETDDVDDIRAAMLIHHNGALPTWGKLPDWQNRARVMVLDSINAAEAIDDED